MLSPRLRPPQPSRPTPLSGSPLPTTKEKSELNQDPTTIQAPKGDKPTANTVTRNRSRLSAAQQPTQSSPSTTSSSAHNADIHDFQAMLGRISGTIASHDEPELREMLCNTLATNVGQIAFIRKLVLHCERERDEAGAERRLVEDCNAQLLEENSLMKQELDDFRSEVSFLKTTIQELDAKLESDEACQEENDATTIHLQNELFNSTEDLQHAVTDFSIATSSESKTYLEYLGAKDQAMIEFERNINRTKIQSVLWKELQQAQFHARHWEDKHDHVYSTLNQCMGQLLASRKEIMVYDGLNDHLRSYTEINMNLHAQLRDNAETIQELKNSLQQAKSINHGTERVIRKHKQEAELYKEQWIPYQRKEQELSAKIYDLEDKLEISQHSEKAIRKEWKVAREHVKYLEADKRIVADKTQAQMKARDKQMKEKEETLASIQQQLNTTQEELQAAQAEDNSKANEERVAQLDNLQSQLDESTIDNTQISRDLAARDMEARNLNAQLTEAEQDLHASRSARNDIARQKELDAEYFEAEQHRLLTLVQEFENKYMKATRKVETLSQTRNQLTQALDRLNASNERLSTDLAAQRVATTKDMHDVQTTIRRLQARARLADENSGFWADALADGVGMSAEWRAEMKRLDRRRGDPRVTQECFLRIRVLLAEREEMLQEIEELRRAAALARSRAEEDTNSEQMEEQYGRFAEVYESVGGDVGEAVRQTLSERSESSAGSRAGEAGSVNDQDEEEEEGEVVAPVLTRRASWS